MSLSDIVARHARATPDAVAFRDGPLTLTWAQTDARIGRCAAALASAGVGPGDRVAILGLNSVPHVEAMVAVLRVGAIGVPVNFRMVAAEVAYLLTDSGATAAVVDETFAPLLEAAGVPSVVLSMGAGNDGPAPEHVAADGDPAFPMYTSGTTGRPKGAVLTHRNLLLHAYSSIAHSGMASDDRVTLSGAPLFHIAGVSGVYLNVVVGGTTVISPSGGFDPAAMLDLLERERISSCFFVPAQWAAIVAVPGIAQRDLSALRRAIWGAAPASTTLLRTMIDTFPQAEITTAFGQTECSPARRRDAGRAPRGLASRSADQGHRVAS